MKSNNLNEITFTKEQSKLLKDYAHKSIVPYSDISDSVQLKAAREIFYMEDTLDVFTIDRIIATVHKAYSRVKSKFDDTQNLIKVLPEKTRVHDYALKMLAKYENHMNNLNSIESILTCNIS